MRLLQGLASSDFCKDSLQVTQLSPKGSSCLGVKRQTVVTLIPHITKSGNYVRLSVESEEEGVDSRLFPVH